MTTAARSGGFEGDLHALSLVEIVQTLNLAGTTARVLLRTSAGTGELWLENGSLTHAAARSLFGELAVFAMIEWTSGRFQVDYGLTCETRSISGDTTHLLLDGLRRIDERSSAAEAERSPAVSQPMATVAVQRQRRAQPLVLGVAGLVLVAIAIVVARIGGGESNAAAPPEPAVTAIPAPVAAPPSSGVAASVKRAPRRPAALVPQTASKLVDRVPVAAPESPLAEEPLPWTMLANNTVPTAEAGTAPAPALSHVKISVKRGSGGGSLVVLVDGSPIFKRDHLDADEPSDAEITVPAGQHLIVARLEGGAEPGVHEDATRGLFVEGATRTLRISANRIFGSPVKVRLGS